MEKYRGIAIEAIRALRNVQWAGRTENTGWACCPFCGGQKEGPPCAPNENFSENCEFDEVGCTVPHELVGHYPECEFVRIMTLAGVEKFIEAGDCG